jgi:hypothetical protein
MAKDEKRSASERTSCFLGELPGFFLVVRANDFQGCRCCAGRMPSNLYAFEIRDSFPEQCRTLHFHIFTITTLQALKFGGATSKVIVEEKGHVHKTLVSA